jgi:anti-sigma factor RsiW
MTNQDETHRGPEIEDLLPWHAAGTLSPREAREVEDAIARDPELMRRYMLAREEMMATVELNEALGQPSPRAMTKLFAAIDAEGERRRAGAGLATRIGEFIASLTPRQLAYSASAAALAILLQAGLIGAIVIGERSQGTQQIASAEKPAHSFAFVRFAPNASAGDIAALLEANRVSIVDGPRPGGLYRVQIAALPQDSSVVYRDIGTPPTAEELRDQAIAKLRSATDIVSFAVPAQ